MAEIEVAGAKIRGNRLLLVLPLLGTLGGGLWAGFEFYKAYMNMRDKIESYTAPDLSGYDKRVAILETKTGDSLDVFVQEMELVKESVELFENKTEAIERMIQEQINDMKSQVGDIKSDVHDIRIELREDVASIMTNLEQQDNRNRNNVEVVRGIINAFEIRMDRKIDKLDGKLESLEENLDMKIRKALENPLSKMATN